MLRSVSGLFLVLLLVSLLMGCGDEQELLVENNASSVSVANWKAGFINEDLIVSFGDGKTGSRG